MNDQLDNCSQTSSGTGHSRRTETKAFFLFFRVISQSFTIIIVITTISVQRNTSDYAATEIPTSLHLLPSGPHHSLSVCFSNNPRPVFEGYISPCLIIIVCFDCVPQLLIVRVRINFFPGHGQMIWPVRQHLMSPTLLQYVALISLDGTRDAGSPRQT